MGEALIVVAFVGVLGGLIALVENPTVRARATGLKARWDAWRERRRVETLEDAYSPSENGAWW